MYKTSIFLGLQIAVYLVCLLNVNELDVANIILLFVPIIYFLCSFTINLREIRARGIAMQFWQIVLFVKYYLMPLYIICSGHRSTIGVGTSVDSFVLGCLMLVYEEIWICVLYIYVYSKRNARVLNFSKIAIPFQTRKLYFFTILLGLGLFAVFRDYFISADAFEMLNLPQSGTSEEREASIGGVLVQFWKEWSFIIFVILIAKRYQRNRQNFYIVVALGLLLLYMLLNLSSSRWTLLFLMLNASYLFYLIFGRRIKKYIYLLGGLVVFLLISITIFKFKWYFESSDGTVLNLLFGQLQSYFSGPNLLAQVIDMNQQKWFSDSLSLSTFVNDVTGSIPIVAKIVDQTDRINAYFGRYVMGWNENLSQIIPMTGIGYSYFGFLFAPLLTVLFTRMGMYFDHKSLSTSNLFYKYVYVYMALWSLLAIAMNTQVIIGNLVVHCVPLVLAYKLLSITIVYGKEKSCNFNFGANI